MSKLVIIVPVSRPEFMPIIEEYHLNKWYALCNIYGLFIDIEIRHDKLEKSIERYIRIKKES